MGGMGKKKFMPGKMTEKKIHARKNPKKKIHAQDGPHFDSRPEFFFFSKKCSKMRQMALGHVKKMKMGLPPILIQKKNVWMQRTTQRRIKLLDLSVAGSLVKEILVPDVTLSAGKTKLIARLVLRQKGKMYWPIFQLAELVFFRGSTMRN